MRKKQSKVEIWWKCETETSPNRNKWKYEEYNGTNGKGKYEDQLGMQNIHIKNEI